MSDHRPCAVIPLYDNGGTIADVVREVRAHVRDVIVVDDGSRDRGADTLEPGDGLVVLRHDLNRGKGAAVKTGIAHAQAQSFSHVVQLDADAQHDSADIPRFLRASRCAPDAIIAGERLCTDPVPGSATFGRAFGVFWYRLETGGHPLTDTQCGYRVYPLPMFDRVRVRGDRMDFDVEVLVRAVWAGVEVRGLPTRVRYFPPEERVSGFQPLRDNLRFSWLHFWMTNAFALLSAGRWLGRLWRRLRGRP
jgi:polyprenyl-phospho-N-acetylgalactosaminyl synthase